MNTTNDISNNNLFTNINETGELINSLNVNIETSPTKNRNSNSSNGESMEVPSTELINRNISTPSDPVVLDLMGKESKTLNLEEINNFFEKASKEQSPIVIKLPNMFEDILPQLSYRNQFKAICSQIKEIYFPSASCYPWQVRDFIKECPSVQKIVFKHISRDNYSHWSSAPFLLLLLPDCDLLSLEEVIINESDTNSIVLKWNQYPNLKKFSINGKIVWSKNLDQSQQTLKNDEQSLPPQIKNVSPDEPKIPNQSTTTENEETQNPLSGQTSTDNNNLSLKENTVSQKEETEHLSSEEEEIVNLLNNKEEELLSTQEEDTPPTSQKTQPKKAETSYQRHFLIAFQMMTTLFCVFLLYQALFNGFPYLWNSSLYTITQI